MQQKSQFHMQVLSFDYATATFSIANAIQKSSSKCKLIYFIKSQLHSLICL